MPAATPALFNRLTWSWFRAHLMVFGPAAFLLICRIHEAAIDMGSLPERDVLHVMHIDAFQVLAWGVAFYLLARLGPTRQPNAIAIAGAVIVCIIGVFSSAAGLATLALLLTLTTSGDVRRLAAATVFAALFAQQAITPILFDLLWPTLTQFDAMLVGSVVKLTISGANWQGNLSVPAITRSRWSPAAARFATFRSRRCVGSRSQSWNGLNGIASTSSSWPPPQGARLRSTSCGSTRWRCRTICTFIGTRVWARTFLRSPPRRVRF